MVGYYYTRRMLSCSTSISINHPIVRSSALNDARCAAYTIHSWFMAYTLHSKYMLGIGRHDAPKMIKLLREQSVLNATKFIYDEWDRKGGAALSGSPINCSPPATLRAIANRISGGVA